MNRQPVPFLTQWLRSSGLLMSVSAVLLGARCLTTAGEPATPQIETRAFRFTLSPADGHCEILDKQANVTWRPAPGHVGFGSVELKTAGPSRRIDLAHCDVRVSGNELTASFRPLSAAPGTILRVRARALDGNTLEITYQEDGDLDVSRVTLLEDVFGVTRGGKGYVVVPAREGMIVPADSGLSFNHRFDSYAYEGCHMLMLGMVRDGAAALVTWDDPYVAAELSSVVSGVQPLSPSLRGRLNGAVPPDSPAARLPQPGPLQIRARFPHPIPGPGRLCHHRQGLSRDRPPEGMARHLGRKAQDQSRARETVRRRQHQALERARPADGRAQRQRGIGPGQLDLRGSRRSRRTFQE